MSKTQTTDPYKKACALLGIKPKPVLKDRGDKDAVSADAYSRLIICIRAKNLLPDGKVWKNPYNGTEWSYWPRWKRNKTGLGFARTNFGFWSTGTGVGSRLEYRSYELMKEGVAEFNDLYQDYLND